MRTITTFLIVLLFSLMAASCSDHYADDKVSAEAADISVKLDSAALPVHPNHFADMSFLAETAEHNLTIHYRYKRQDHGISISANGAIDTICPKIYGDLIMGGLPGLIMVDAGKVYENKSPLHGPVKIFPEFQVPFNTVLREYASSKGKSIANFYIEMHLTDGMGGTGPYLHSHFFGFDECNFSGRTNTYLYTFAADTLEAVFRTYWPHDGHITLQRYDYSVMEPKNCPVPDGVFASEADMEEYLLDEFERTFGERCGDILISDLRRLWTQYKEKILEIAGRTSAEE